MKTPEEIKKGLESCRADECHGHHIDCPYKDDSFCIMRVCGDALAYIERLEFEHDAALAKVPKWISVEERLPEMYEDGSADIVLVTDGQFIHMAAYSNENWYFAECGEMKEPMFYKVTHWMPLPESPKEANA